MFHWQHCQFELRPNPRQHQFKPGDGAGALDGGLLLQVGGDLLNGEIGEPLGAVLGIVSGARVVQADEPRKAAQSEFADDDGEGLPLELLIAHLVDSGWSRHCTLLFHHLTYPQILAITSSNPAMGPVPCTEVGCARSSGCSPGR